MQVKVTIDIFRGTITNGSPFLYVKKGDVIDISDEEWEVIQKHYRTWFSPVEKEKVEIKSIEDSPENKMISSRKRK